MLPIIDRILFGPLVALWLRYARGSWWRLPMPSDSPHVHSWGTDPDRLLISGDGTSAGRGVMTHDLGLPGYLARSLSSLTGRATDVDIVVSGDMTAKKCAAAITDLELSRYDAILLSVGGVEALLFTPAKRWKRDLTALLNQIDLTASASTAVFTLSIPLFSPRRLLPALLAKAIDRQVVRLNRITIAAIAARPQVTYLEMGEADSLESAGAHTYELWAAGLAPQINRGLAPRTGANPRGEDDHETERQTALEAMGILDLSAEPALDEVTRRARDAFGTAFAAITLVDGHRQKFVSADGLPSYDIARQESICDVAIRRTEHLAVEDTLLEPRFAKLRIVNSGPRVRFYAGYPIESPDGHRIGALCILDPKPRAFTNDDAALLRLLAQEAQLRLWHLSAEKRRPNQV